ncbi:arylesterase [Thioclava sp. FR2]|uniref:arylesterase n=1 Tax=Thioclava sp. FR2 TaxID=3445780 RepID=UPI003EBF029E
MNLSLFLSTFGYGAMRLARNLVFTLALPVSGAFAEPVRVLALGDSLTAGYGLMDQEGLVPQLNAWMAENGAEITVMNAGVSGDTSTGGLSRLGWALDGSIQAMMVILGGNDLLRGIPPEATRAAIEGILKEAQARNLPVLLVGMKAPGNFGPEYKDSFDRLYPDLAAKYGALHIDSYFGLLVPDANDPAQLQPYMQPDGIHPNAEGVKVIVGNLAPKIVELAAQVR